MSAVSRLQWLDTGTGPKAQVRKHHLRIGKVKGELLQVHSGPNLTLVFLSRETSDVRKGGTPLYKITVYTWKCPPWTLSRSPKTYCSRPVADLLQLPHVLQCGFSSFLVSGPGLCVANVEPVVQQPLPCCLLHGNQL